MSEYKDNCIAAQAPELMNEWDYETNIGISPYEVTVGSRINVNWIGKCGHKWGAIVKDRVRGYGCPICAGKRVVIGINDLQSNYPNIAEEWDYERNVGIKPYEITAKSGKKYWWLCKNGHSFINSVSERVRGRGCPFCGRKKVIKGETDLSSGYPILAKEWMTEKNNVNADEVFRNSHIKAWWRCSVCDNEWQATVDSRTAGNGCPRCARRMQTSFPEQAMFYYIKQVCEDAVNGYRDIFDNVMELDVYIPSKKVGVEYDGKHWHNGEKSQRREAEKYNICKKQGIKLIRVVEGKNCNNCDEYVSNNKSLDEAISRLLVLINESTDVNTKRDRNSILEMFITNLKNDSLEAKYPEYAAEWHPTKNGNLKPGMFTAHNDGMFWWICSNGHEYQSTIAHRTGNSGCPYCAHRKVLVGYNDFATTSAESSLLQEWDYEKNDNNKIYPQSIMAGSKKKVWWLCSKGHSWEASVQTRTKGQGCPVCSSNLIVPGVNDFESIHPELMREWDVSKNTLDPSRVGSASNYKVWWICSKGHEWEAVINSRHQGSGCPICCNSKVLSGYNDLWTTNETIAKEWHPEKNGDLLPSMITAGSDRKVWWKCEKGHEWEAVVRARSKGSNCPVCSGRRVIAGYNDLETLKPDLVKQWNFNKNNNIHPSNVSLYSNLKVWWRCEKGHEWEAKIESRVYGNECPYCNNRKILVGFNDFATVHKELGMEWDATKNGNLRPTDVMANSTKKVWWKCSKGHEWIASVGNRSRGTGCPICAKNK